MKTRRYDILIALLFCLFLGGMLLAFLLLPKHSFSAREKRYLAEAPKLSWRNVASGAFSDAAETYDWRGLDPDKVRRASGETGVEALYTGHCTGKKAMNILRSELGDKVHELRTGLVFEL